MAKRSCKNFSPELRLETAPLVLDHRYTHEEAPKATPMTPEQLKIRELEKKIEHIELEKEILKKSTVDVGLTEQFGLIKKLIQSHKAKYSIKMLCHVFEVHHSSYKYWQLRDTSLSAEEVTMRAEVKSAHDLGGGSAGARTIAEIVTQRGFQLSRYRATRFMKGLELVSCQLPQYAHKKGSKEHVLGRQFDVTEPNQVWCGDVTYI